MLTVYILKIQLSNVESSQLPSAPPLVTWLTFASSEFRVPFTFLDSSSRLSWTPFGPLHGCSLTCYCSSSGRKFLELQGNFKATFWKFQCVSFQSPASAKSPSNVERIWYERVQLGRTRLPFLLQHDYQTMFSKPSSKHLEPSFTDKESLNNCPTLVVLKIPGAMTWTVEESVKSKGDIPIGTHTHTHTHPCSRKSFHFAAANPRWLIRSSKSLIWDKGFIKTHSPEVLFLRSKHPSKNFSEIFFYFALDQRPFCRPASSKSLLPWKKGSATHMPHQRPPMHTRSLVQIEEDTIVVHMILLASQGNWKLVVFHQWSMKLCILIICL